MDFRRPDLKRKRRLRQIVLAAAAVVAMIAAAVGIGSLDSAAPRVDRATVWTDTVQSGEFVREVRGPGNLVPREIRWIPAQSAGRVEHIRVRPGAQVEPDTILVELSNPNLVEEAEEARWAIATAESQQASREADLDRQVLDARAVLMSLESEYESARLQADAESELAEQGIVSSIQSQQSALHANQLERRVEFESQRLARLHASTEAQRRAEQALVEQAGRQYQRLNRQVQNLQVRAGVAGMVQEVPVEEGQQLAAGVNVARVARPEELIAEIRISETRAREVVVGQPARIDTRSGIIPGTVMRIDPAVRDGTVTVDVELNGELPPGARPDLSVDGIVELDRLENVLHVARPAHGQPEASTQLFRVDADGYARRVPVALGRASVNRIEIVEGLQSGDLVVLSDMSQWDEHERIRLID